MITAEEFLLEKFKSLGVTKEGLDIFSNSLIEFAKLHVEAALKAAAESRCLKMFDKNWYAYTLEPGTKILRTVNTIIDKEAIINAYPLNNIK